MSLLAAYQQAISQQAIVADAEQQIVVHSLEIISQQLIRQQQQTRWKRIQTKLRKSQKIKGLYIWGGVGIGKTYLLDLFFRELPFTQKLRKHFHEFMRYIHRQLTELQGEKNPLTAIAKQVAKKYKVLCFDEFFVNDIGDAMLLGNLFTQLFNNGVTVVATSNVAPDDLYKNGLQRKLFLPAIAAIKQNMDVQHVASHYDYRQSPLLTHYYFPLTEFVADKLHEIFMALAENVIDETSITINQRSIPVVARAKNVIWFNFSDLCQVPRSQDDYLEIADQFDAVILSQVPQIAAYQHHLITYFINLVDVFYDKKIKLFISAAVPIHEIYPKGRKAFEFQRTQSRLQEMQADNSSVS